MEEHRRFNRADFHTRGYFEYNSSKIDFKIINVSLNGILVETEKQEDIPSNTIGSLIIQLSSSEIKIATKAILLHKEESHLGFRFEEIDVESMIHLRRLVELNSDNADQISQELHFLRKK